MAKIIILGGLKDAHLHSVLFKSLFCIYIIHSVFIPNIHLKPQGAIQWWYQRDGHNWDNHNVFMKGTNLVSYHIKHCTLLTLFASLGTLQPVHMFAYIPQDNLSIHATTCDDVWVRWVELEAEDIFWCLQ